MTIGYSDYCTEDEIIKIKLDTGGELAVRMKQRYLGYYGPNTDIEIDFSDDDAKDVCFKIGGAFYTALEIIQWCNMAHDEIHADVSAAERAQGEMDEELRSPYWSGRV